MNFDNSSKDDLWAEFGDENTSISRKVEILWILGVRERRAHGGGEPLQYWLPALNLAREHQLRAQWIELCDDIARHYITTLNDNQAGLDYANEGLGLIPEICFDTEERESQAHLTWGKAFAFENMNRLDEAIFYYKAASEMYGDLGNSLFCNTLRSKLIECYLENGQLEEAEELIPETREQFQARDNLYQVATLDSFKGHILVLKGQVDQGLKLLLEAKSVLSQIHYLEPQLLVRIGFAYFSKREYQHAKKYYKKAKAMAMSPHLLEYGMAIKATLGIADAFEALGNKEKAAKARYDAGCIEDRTAKALNYDSEKAFKEIDKLRKIGEFDIAIQLGAEMVEAQANAGNIKLHLRAECENLFTLFFNKKYDEVLFHWDRLPKLAIDADDDLAIRVKNMVVHAMFRCNRVDEAKELCYKVLADVRLQSDRQEMAYAYENLAEIEPDLELRKRHQSVAIESNLEANNPTRALQITRKFREEY